MTVPSNLDVVRELFERFRSDDPQEMLEMLSEDFEVEVPPSLSAEPDVYRGHEGALRYLRGFDGQLEQVRFEPIEMFEEDGLVIVPLRLTGRGATSGIEVTQHAVVVHWVEDGKVARMQPFPDLDSARDGVREFE
jgi:ketosteroid isomerase-like protein